MTGQEGGSPSATHLFTLNLWPEALGTGQSEWRGQVRHIPSGDTRYFRDWQTLLLFLETTLQRTDV